MTGVLREPLPTTLSERVKAIIADLDRSIPFEVTDSGKLKAEDGFFSLDGGSNAYVATISQEMVEERAGKANDYMGFLVSYTSANGLHREEIIPYALTLVAHED